VWNDDLGLGLLFSSISHSRIFLVHQNKLVGWLGSQSPMFAFVIDHKLQCLQFL
jgi:hypothetical protein